MTTVHLVRHDPQALRYYPALELGREESVVPAKQEPGRDFRPRRQRPRLLERRPGLGPGVTTRLGRQVRGEVVAEDRDRVERLGEDVSGISPPVPRGLAGMGHHGRHQDHQLHGDPLLRPEGP